MKKMLVLLSAFVLTIAELASAGSFSDPFDALDSAWVTDRFEPAGFSSVVFDGDNRLEIAISATDSEANRPAGFTSGFYNTQGRQRDALMAEPWVISGDLYLSLDMLLGDNLRRTDLWARTSDGPEANAQYPIIGMRRFDPLDPFNPLAGDIASTWRVWDSDTVDGWVNLATPMVAGWNTLSIESDGLSYLYRINGVEVYEDLTISAFATDLTTVFLQGYNFGGDYEVYWDNVSAATLAPVPEPATILLLMLGAGVVAIRRHFAKQQ
ncbi:MAG: hypothetical protein COV08_01010 [Candidatus Vogelbacteria bacterium CG10_big_fil_rev_8_21_14_0_10_49_38]|uniref:Ice-binding protein C-terminal domain-containing protein n=1 Tax=Candidatus Vogelbacteria bacterium CG10_big_fil_rev_8_21_14_0_10_49_38 TaxID=1975043 RepID=A0A2H0RI63_9BACT|nr:MAG: hypothetical protein BK006_01020 [bacterium CG10_49_38]PIR46183.1 MAG: hypothetical protein COV08_01010 [Candidatus Vogelbacteria bacterium CG10_big_fil_rev_8_21_14_0_10_49_38]